MNRNPLYLLDRIRNLNVSLIEDMSSDAMAMITDSFDESLVRNVLYVGKTNREQRKIIKCIKDNYKCWKKETEMFWGTLPQFEVYPDFILELQMDIECGMVVTVEGSVSEPQSEPFVMPPVLGESLRRLKGLSETVADNNTLKYKAIIEEKEKRIAKLETEMAELKRKYEEEEFRKAVNEAEYLSSNKPSPLSLRIAKGKETSVLVTLDGMHKAGWIEGATRDEAIKEISLKLFGKEISTPAQRVSNARNTANPHIYKEAIEKAKEETENVLENLEDMEKYLLKK